MQSLTKTQVLALFLGTASAAILDDLKAVTDAAQQVDGGAHLAAATQVAWAASCNALGGCDDANQKCATLAAEGNTCVAEELCGAYGKIGGVVYTVACWTAVAEGETPAAPTALNQAALDANYLALESLITKDTLTPLTSESDILVSSRFNYQDGWWVKAGSQWQEYDKPRDSRCFLDLQCDAAECCSLYPDTNNRRCLAKTEVNKTITVGPVTFTPSCAGIAAEDIVPENAQDDIAKGALTEANEEINKWTNNLLTDAKKDAGYDTETCDQACKDKFDADWKAGIDQKDKDVAKLKALVGYDTDACDDGCKAAFQAELLKWTKATYEICKDNEKAPACADAQAIREEVEKARAGNAVTDKNYYSAMTANEREEHEKAEADLIAKQEASIIAAAAEAGVPAGGEGSSCAGEAACTGAGQCCGNSVMASVVAPAEPTADQKKDLVCVTVAEGAKTASWDDQFGRGYTHTCQLASKLVSSVAAAAIAAYYM